MIVVLFGQPHSGKTTLGELLQEFLQLEKHNWKTDVHHLDGDALRKLYNNKDYSKEGRIANLNRASDIAAYLDSKGLDVVMSLVYPYIEARTYLISLNTNVKWIYLTYDCNRGREEFHVKDFDIPKDENVLCINTSNLSIDECKDNIITYINELN
jgi:adenylylsulfate kinase-like enzyme